LKKEDAMYALAKKPKVLELINKILSHIIEQD